MATRMQQRRGTAAQWTAASPILAAGEIGFETDTGKFKIGDGTNVWSSLSYFTDSQDFDTSNFVLNTQKGAAGGVATLNSNGHVPINQLGALIDNAPSALDTLHELADALTAIDTVVGAHAGLSTNVHGIVDTAALATKDYADNSVSTHNNLTLNAHGISNTANLAYQVDIQNTEQYADNAVSAHNSVTTGVHGIADTTLLATQEYADDSASTAQLAAQGYTDAQLEVHNLDATNVHGIPDTSLLATKAYADSVGADAVSDASLDATTKANNAKAEAIAEAALDATAKADAAEVDAKAYTDTEIDAHILVTQNVHGIADTTALALTVDVNAGLALKQDKVTGVSDTEIGYLDGVTSAIQTQLNGKAASSHSHAQSDITNLTTDLAAKAPLANPTFTGTVNAADVVLSGNLTVNGTTTTVSTANFTTEDALLYIGEGNNANLVDLGFVASFNDGTYQHSGLVKDSSDAKWKLFKGVTDEPTTTVNFAQGSLDALAVGALEATTVTPSSGIVFSDGTQTKVGVPSITAIATAISSSTTLAAGEQDKFVPLTGAVTITLPATGYSTGQSIDFYQASGTGAQFASTNGVVGTPGLKFRTTYSVVTAMKISGGWLVFGDLSA